MRFKTFIFDLYGTLVDIHTDEQRPELWEELSIWFSGMGADYTPQGLKGRYFEIVRELESGSVPVRQDSHEAHPEIKIEEVFLRLFTEAGVGATLELAIRAGEHFRRLSLDYIRLYDGAAELLRGLADAGGRVYLLSNAQAIFTRLELRELGIEDLFHGIYLSSDYGCRKPDRRFFEILLSERGIVPGEAVMIGNDGLCDIEGAKSVGLHTVYIRSNISPVEETPGADFVFEGDCLGEVYELLMGR